MGKKTKPIAPDAIEEAEVELAEAAAENAENAEIEEVAEGIDVENANAETAESVDLNVDAIIKRLQLDGAKKFKARVTNVNVTKKINVLNSEYAMISFTLDKKVPRFMENDEGIVEKKMSNIIFTTNISVNAVLKQKTEMGIMIAAYIKEAVESPKPELLKRVILLLGGAQIEFLQEFVPAGTEYVNPFSQQENPEPDFIENDTIINHISNIQLGVMGRQALMTGIEALMK